MTNVPVMWMKLLKLLTPLCKTTTGHNSLPSLNSCWKSTTFKEECIEYIHNGSLFHYATAQSLWPLGWYGRMVVWALYVVVAGLLVSRGC